MDTLEKVKGTMLDFKHRYIYTHLALWQSARKTLLNDQKELVDHQSLLCKNQAGQYQIQHIEDVLGTRVGVFP
jgi:hypothetical protein